MASAAAAPLCCRHCSAAKQRALWRRRHARPDESPPLPPL